MLRENIRLQYPFRITDGNQAENGVSYLHHKGMKLPAIVTEPAAVSNEDAFNENRVKHWQHEIKLHCSDLSDRPSFDRPLLKDIDA
jgi:hypothetical protein